MEFSSTRSRVPALLALDETDSTNDDLRAVITVGGIAGPFHTVATTTQRAGRGRSGRTWQAPAGATLAASIAVPLGDDFRADRIGWLGIAAGVATVRALRSFADDERRVMLKWPNDVLIDGRKAVGILGEIAIGCVADASEQSRIAIIGIGVNTGIAANELPTPEATSMLVAFGRAADQDAVLARIVDQFAPLVERLASHGGDADASGLRVAAIEVCVTLGVDVEMALPGGDTLRGRAVDIDESARLVLNIGPDPETGEWVTRSVAAGDVSRVRPTDHSAPGA